MTVIGDGRSQTLTMAGDKLWNIDALVKVGEEAPMPAPIKDTRKALSEKVFRCVHTCIVHACRIMLLIKMYNTMNLFHSLEEGGQTALGPALLVSISIASRVPGSKVQSTSIIPGAHEPAKECLNTHTLVILCVANKCELHIVSLIWQPIRI